MINILSPNINSRHSRENLKHKFPSTREILNVQQISRAQTLECFTADRYSQKWHGILINRISTNFWTISQPSNQLNKTAF
uniref:Uncharacterized protein n=1 Tax=Onchocerca volvulus TaxID=6282 RepID=A0A8R1XYG2_ONCVO